MVPYSTQTARARTEVLSAFMRGVYGWMSAGLLVTAVVAWLTATSPALFGLVFNVNPATGAAGPSMLFWVLVIAQLGLVFALSGAVQRMSGGMATGLFLAYSALTGVTLSSIFLVYSLGSIAKTFLVASGMFGAMSVYGLVTRRDLTRMGSFLFMGLIGIVLASLVNMFFRSPAADFVISVLGVIIFTGLTAYDTQRLKDMGEVAAYGDAAALRRGTILGALTLYLDFINLFLMLLRFMGQSRE
ncbi:Bax inhibitor-1/YccA family protein [Desulfovibrio aminophilus]|nr:Bax inhibitor-1/YccA family protein [Desulfovibrio aminophilus]MCM0754942.1 Bax inhibitor-1/YccA family protein [Desulfovibrio aminophilus]